MPGLTITVFCGLLCYCNSLHNGCQPTLSLGSFIALTSSCTWKSALVTSSRNITVPGRASHTQGHPHHTLHIQNNENSMKLWVKLLSLCKQSGAEAWLLGKTALLFVTAGNEGRREPHDNGCYRRIVTRCNNFSTLSFQFNSIRFFG